MKNIKTVLILLYFIFTTSSFASGWFCKEVASERNGNTINSCGVGTGATEADARKNALQMAYEEGDTICRPSIDCNPYEWVVTPLRNECKPFDGGYRCYRGITITITDKNRDNPDSPRKLLADGSAIFVMSKRKVVALENPDSMTATVVATFKTEPNGAEILIDGISLCTMTPCSKALTTGEHQLEISGVNDFSPLKRKIFIKENDEEFNFKLTYLKGIIYFDGDFPDRTSVFINNLKVENISNPLHVVPGEYHLEIRNPFYDSDIKIINIKKNETRVIRFEKELLEASLFVEAEDIKGNALVMEIFVDGIKQKVKTPAQLRLKSGDHNIEVTKGVLKDSFKITLYPEKVEKKKLILNEEQAEEKRIEDNKKEEERRSQEKERKAVEDNYEKLKKWMLALDGIGTVPGPVNEEHFLIGGGSLTGGHMLTNQFQLRLGLIILTGNKGKVSYPSTVDDNGKKIPGPNRAEKEINGGEGKVSLPYYFTPALYFAPQLGVGTYNLTYRRNDYSAAGDPTITESKLNVFVMSYGFEVGYFFVIDQRHGPRVILGYQSNYILKTSSYNAEKKLGRSEYSGTSEPYLALGWEWRF